MPTNQFFNNYGASTEQEFLEDLIVEATKIYGMDMYYITRTLVNLDRTYLTDDQSLYENSYMVECYIENIMGFGGDRDLMTKFMGAEIRDQITVSIPRRSFESEVGFPAVIARPREGDIIYFPMNQKVFQIKFVDQYNMFYALGTLQSWKLTCELFEYSNEVFDTGIPEIDEIQLRSSINVQDYSLLDTDGSLLLTEDGDFIVIDAFDFEDVSPLSDNKDTRDKADEILNWSETDPFSQGDSGNVV
jgi:hypothetical protein